MSNQFAIRMMGKGGQGILLAGLMLAEAAAIYDNKYAVQTQAYGPQVRGGTSRSDIIIDSSPIDYPLIVEADVVLALSQRACGAHLAGLKKDGMLIVDSERVTRVPKVATVVAIPLTSWAQEATGKAITANVLSLGFAMGLTDVVSRPAMTHAVAARAPRGTEQVNLSALAAGYDHAHDFQEEGSPREIVEAILQLAERGSISAVARLRGVKEDRINAWVQRAAAHWRSLESILLTEYHLSRAQIDILWKLVLRRGEKGAI